MLVLPESEFRTELFIETRFFTTPSLCHDQLTAQYSCSSTAVAYNRSRKSLFAAPPYTPSAAAAATAPLPLLLLRPTGVRGPEGFSCGKFLPGRRYFLWNERHNRRDIIPPARLRIPPVPCTKLSSPHNERATKVILTKVPDQKFPKNFYFSRNFMLP